MESDFFPGKKKKKELCINWKGSTFLFFDCFIYILWASIASVIASFTKTQNVKARNTCKSFNLHESRTLLPKLKWLIPNIFILMGRSFFLFWKSLWWELCSVAFYQLRPNSPLSMMLTLVTYLDHQFLRACPRICLQSTWCTQGAIIKGIMAVRSHGMYMAVVHLTRNARVPLEKGTGNHA